MIKRYSTFLVICLISGLLIAPSAYGQKIGYANQEAILANMPEMREVQKKLRQAARQQQQELQQERKEFQQSMQQYRQQQSLLSDSAKAQRERELRQKQQQLQKSSQQRQQELRKREQELMQPLLEDLQSAIETVSAREELDLVLRSQALLDVDQNSSSVVNISPAVAEELGIDLPQAPAEPTPTVEPGAPTTQGGGGQ